MIPRIDVATLEVVATRKILEKYVSTSEFSRMPVYHKNIDDLLGIVHVKDLFKALLESNNSKKIDLQKHLSPPCFTPESRKIKDLLKDLQKSKSHMSLVIDEYGGFSGIVTMEDILEELIGDVQDEFDNDQQMIEKISRREYSIDARTPLEEINTFFEIHLEKDDADTIGGFLVNMKGYIPKRREIIVYKNFEFKITAKRGNSITRLKMKVKQKNIRSKKS